MLSPEEWTAYAQEQGVQGQQLDGVLAMLEDADLWRRSEELSRFFSAVQAYGVSDYVRFAPHIIRGLDYYTGTVSEAWDQDGEFRAILGGGRYDNLVADVGGDPLAGVGFAMGDVVMGLVLDKFGRLPATVKSGLAPILIAVVDEQATVPALQLAAELRAAGLRVAYHPKIDRLGKQLRYADRIGSPVVVILGPDEIARGMVIVKDLRTSEQHTVGRADVPKQIQELLSQQGNET